MDKCEGCSSRNKCGNKESCMIENNPLNRVKNIIGVMSGKGGVGKSTISVLIAEELNRKGYKVGIMDADITGPSIPRFFGAEEERALSDLNGIIPVETDDGIKMMSMNFLTEYEEQPVIWRGPIISGVVKQFWTDVIWGDLDYLIIDMPPGTGDVALTAMQSIPINGIVMVSTPQDLVSMIVAKAVNMAKQMNIKVLGVVENMSYMVCPGCGKKIKLIKNDTTGKFLKDMGLKLLGELPMCEEIINIPGMKSMELNGELQKVVDDMAENILSSLQY